MCNYTLFPSLQAELFCKPPGEKRKDVSRGSSCEAERKHHLWAVSKHLQTPATGQQWYVTSEKSI